VPPYICARRTGGTSALQIIKKVDGVETLLKSVAVTNPAIGVPFEIRCQATRFRPRRCRCTSMACSSFRCRRSDDRVWRERRRT
jgi:hypothetical protein